MASYRQVWDEEQQKFLYIPIGVQDKSANHAVHGDIEPFKSPIDGSIIADRKQYREHCKKHNVVPAQEFSPEFYRQKAAERAKVFQGEHSTAESFARKQQIHEIWNHLERKS